MNKLLNKEWSCTITLFVCCTRLGGLQSLDRISPIHQKKARSTEVGKPFPCDQQTLQSVHKQKLLEEYGLSNALGAHGETPDHSVNSAAQFMPPANRIWRNPFKKRAAQRRTRKTEALQSRCPSVRFLLSMLPPTGETTKIKTQTPPFLCQTQVISNQV